MNDKHIGAAEWKKSSLSSVNGNCVEVATLDGGLTGVRDSKERSGPVLVFAREEWGIFIGAIKKDGLDL
ncbi:DUF397 domain-containing protein [Streptosporangium amethystogenes]|uniref:DUF397 domain-containing protein n=1 Tax=Streptosporangium amethystogenes TaxID=2002 RepID=UPI0004C9B385|nr:DUF397 domain-containing protein [Streptosporangium amethystogenes]